MFEGPKQIVLIAAATSVAALGGAGVADAATTHKSHAKKHAAKKHAKKRHSTASSTSSGGNAAETELTGATAQSAKDAALAAVPGGTVTRASTEDPNDASGAAYEIHVTKSDGSRVEVLEDSSFKVLSVTADGHGCNGAGGRGGNSSETALTGATAQSANDAALAAVPGGTVESSSTEDPNDSSGAAYEVHVRKSDGTEVEVLENSSFNVIATRTGGHHH